MLPFSHYGQTGTMEGFSLDLDDEADGMPKSFPHQSGENDGNGEKTNGKTKKKADKASVSSEDISVICRASLFNRYTLDLTYLCKYIVNPNVLRGSVLAGVVTEEGQKSREQARIYGQS